MKVLIAGVLAIAAQAALPFTEAAAPPRGLAALCAAEPAYCSRDDGRAADRLQASPELFALLNRVNREVNRTLRYRSDRRAHGEADRWSRPGVGRAGDCEDYVLAKRDRLLRAGLPARALAVAAVHSRETGFHAVLVALERDMTIRTLILTALRDAGVEIPEDDLGNARAACASERVAVRG